MRIFKFAICFCLSLILLFLLILLQVSFFTSNKVLNAEYYISNFQKYDLYSYVYNSINRTCGNISRTDNLPANLFQDIVTKPYLKSQIDESTRVTVDYMLYKTDKLPEVDTKALSDKFNENLENFIKEKDVKVNSTVRQELNLVKSDVESVYSSSANFINLKSISNASFFEKLRRALYYVSSQKQLIFGFITAVTLLLFLASMKTSYSALHWISYSSIAAGLFSLIPSSIGLFTRFMDNIGILDPTLKAIAISFIRETLSYFAISGAALLLAGIVLLGAIAALGYKPIKV